MWMASFPVSLKYRKEGSFLSTLESEGDDDDDGDDEDDDDPQDNEQ